MRTPDSGGSRWFWVLGPLVISLMSSCSPALVRVRHRPSGMGRGCSGRSPAGMHRVDATLSQLCIVISSKRAEGSVELSVSTEGPCGIASVYIATARSKVSLTAEPMHMVVPAAEFDESIVVSAQAVDQCGHLATSSVAELE